MQHVSCMGHRNTAVWIDQQEARIFGIDAGSFSAAELKAPTHHLHRHPRSTQEPTEHPEDAKRYFHDVAGALAGSDEILIVGPGAAKLELLKYVSKHAPDLEPKIVGVETVDHPTDRQLAAYARKYFLAADRMNKPV